MDAGTAGLDELQGQLERWVVAMYDEHAAITGLHRMPGHAGLSFGFDVVHHDVVLDPLVLRMPPKGVRQSGNTDVLRQVPLLQALWNWDVPVPETRWWDDDERWFGVPYTMVARLPGDTVSVRGLVEALGQDAARIEAESVLDQAIDALARTHLLPWERMLAEWESPRPLIDEVRIWDGLLDESAESEWLPEGSAVRDLLLASIPDQPLIGLFHGDFQTNNLLFDAGQLVAVLDWEISGIGAQLLDLGWLLMMNDPSCWAHGGGLNVVPEHDALVARYAAATGRTVQLADVAWYRALAGYRFGAITCSNVMLHRSGQRSDPEWERIAPSVPYMFARASELLGA